MVSRTSTRTVPAVLSALVLVAGLAVLSVAGSPDPATGATATQAMSAPGPAADGGKGNGKGKKEGKLLRPDLIALRAWDYYMQQTAEGRKMRFTSGLGNLGRGPIEVRPDPSTPCPGGKQNSRQVIYRDGDGNNRYGFTEDRSFALRRAGCMIFHPQHNHWHFQASARYQLIKAAKKEKDRVVAVARKKMSFCLRDSDRLPEWYGTWRYPERYGECAKTTPQGISVGWMDVYQNFLAGQALRLPAKLKDGVYCLKTVVDPKNQLVETDDTNNASVRALAIKGDRILTRKQSFCRGIL